MFFLGEGFHFALNYIKNAIQNDSLDLLIIFFEVNTFSVLCWIIMLFPSLALTVVYQPHLTAEPQIVIEIRDYGGLGNSLLARGRSSIDYFLGCGHILDSIDVGPRGNSYDRFSYFEGNTYFRQGAVSA